MFNGGVDVNGSLRWERDKSHSTQDAHLANEARRFTEENHFNDVVNQARQATHDNHFRTSDDQSARLADSFTTGYDQSMHYREEAQASLTQSQSYHQQATLAQEQTASINLDAQTGFVDWLSQHRAPNSQGTIGLQQAEWMMRHDPEMAQAYARQYVAEKTSQSVGQFKQQHPMGAHKVQQTYQSNQDHIVRNQVDVRGSEYNQMFQDKAKSLPVGSVNSKARQDVKQDMAEVHKDIQVRNQAMIESGERVMQGVIVTQANSK